MYAYSRGRNIHDAQPQRRTVATFATFVDALDRDRAARKGGAAYVCGPLNGTGHRCAEGAEPRRWVALDLDRIDAELLPEVRMWFAARSGCAWPTHSSKPDAPRERVILELDRDATRAECLHVGAVLARDLAAEFGDAILLDESTFRGEQPVFVPPAGVTLARFSGDPLPVDAYLAEPVPQDTRQDAPERPTGAARIGEGGRNAALSKEAYRLRKRGCDAAQIESILQGMNGTLCDPPLPAGEVRTIARGKLGVEVDAQGEVDAEPESWPLPASITLDEWHTAELAPPCIVEGYLFADVAELVAPGSTGKTTTVLFEAVCIALGLPLWGLRVHRPGGVLIVTAEDRRSVLVARLREVCAALGLSEQQRARVRELVRIDDRTAAPRRLTVSVAETIMPSHFAHAIVQGCQASGFAPVLVQFDPMVRFGIGEQRVNDGEQALIEAARIVVAGLGCCCRYTHHSGKMNAREKTLDQYTGRGGSALADGCRMVHVMQALDAEGWRKATGRTLDDGQSAFVLARPKISYAPPQPPLYVVRTGYAFKAVQPEVVDAQDQREADARQLLTLLQSELAAKRRHSANTLQTIRPENLTRGRFRAALGLLQADGRVTEREREPHGKGGSYRYLHPAIGSPNGGGEPI